MTDPHLYLVPCLYKDKDKDIAMPHSYVLGEKAWHTSPVHSIVNPTVLTQSPRLITNDNAYSLGSFFVCNQ